MFSCLVLAVTVTGVFLDVKTRCLEPWVVVVREEITLRDFFSHSINDQYACYCDFLKFENVLNNYFKYMQLCDVQGHIFVTDTVRCTVQRSMAQK